MCRMWISCFENTSTHIVVWCVIGVCQLKKKVLRSSEKLVVMLTGAFCRGMYAAASSIGASQTTAKLTGTASFDPFSTRALSRYGSSCLLRSRSIGMPGVAALTPAWIAGVECCLSDDSRPDFLLLPLAFYFSDVACLLTRRKAFANESAKAQVCEFTGAASEMAEGRPCLDRASCRGPWTPCVFASAPCGQSRCPTCPRCFASVPARSYP